MDLKYCAMLLFFFSIMLSVLKKTQDFPGGSEDKESACNVGDSRDTVQPLGQEDLEEEMTTHFTALAWKIPWTEEPGGLQSMGLQRVRQEWVTNTHWRKNSSESQWIDLLNLERLWPCKPLLFHSVWPSWVLFP